MVRRIPTHGLILAVLLVVALVTLGPSARAASGPPGKLDCAALDCGSVLPGVSRFEPAPVGAAYAVGLGAEGKPVGWVVLSTDVVDVKAYSGKPLVTLIGLTPDGKIAGVRVLHHSEPILLVGIPEKALHDFAAKYVGLHATTTVEVGSSKTPGAVQMDIVSGATVTVLAQNQTIMDSVRALGAAVGVIADSAVVPGHFVTEARPWTWAEMVEKKVFGRLTVSEAEMGLAGSTETFIDLYYAVADPPQIGRALLGDREYEWLIKELAAGEHVLIVLGNGSSSFKGSGFARGGLFDRVRLEQGLRSVMFRDSDYVNLSGVEAAGAPSFKEGAVFKVRAGKLDPGSEFSLVFLGSRYNQRGGFSRDFQAVRSKHRVPRTVYALDGPDPEEMIWRNAWKNRMVDAAALAAFLFLIAGVFRWRRYTAIAMWRIKTLHNVALVGSFLWVGLYLHAQPSVTQVLTLIGSVLGEWRWSLFLSEPLLWVSWIFIAVVTVFWGRGVFCGWACPYGAMSELIFRLGRALRLPKLELPERVHDRLRHLRYVVLAALVGVFLYSPELGEKLAEIEPFKSTFFVRPWLRHWGLFAWWLALLGAALVWYRPFCRYLCPLGAALAIPGSIRPSGPYRRAFCAKCKICTRGCEPRAIRNDGSIDPRECLSCMECEANFNDAKVCPPLVGIERLTRKLIDAGPKEDRERLRRLQHEASRGPRIGWRRPASIDASPTSSPSDSGSSSLPPSSAPK